MNDLAPWDCLDPLGRPLVGPGRLRLVNMTGRALTTSGPQDVSGRQP